MFHCEKCYDTPCLCGYGYIHLKAEELHLLIVKLINLRNTKIPLNGVVVDVPVKTEENAV